MDTCVLLPAFIASICSRGDVSLCLLLLQGHTQLQVQPPPAATGSSPTHGREAVVETPPSGSSPSGSAPPPAAASGKPAAAVVPIPSESAAHAVLPSFFKQVDAEASIWERVAKVLFAPSTQGNGARCTHDNVSSVFHSSCRVSFCYCDISPTQRRKRS